MEIYLFIPGIFFLFMKCVYLCIMNSVLAVCLLGPYALVRSVECTILMFSLMSITRRQPFHCFSVVEETQCAYCFMDEIHSCAKGWHEV